MNTKLTLNIDKQIIEKAKLVSKKNGQSLSKIIEHYLKLIIAKENETSKSLSISEKLSGILEEPKESYSVGKAKHLLKKHA
ncbi:MAG: DUF6364 family protein [Bacteroidia bacterium]|nr:DUF6364 family protein [Bacteroidia bacterium]MCF8426134.1 DUF6364 family protein [Bacteroidia bacterium]MCF8447344.1 DUF6364 family protein [Bacteroidia bacterium]